MRLSSYYESNTHATNAAAGGQHRAARGRHRGHHHAVFRCRGRCRCGRAVPDIRTAAGADHLVTIQDTAGGTTLGSFTVMRSSSEVFEKEPTDVIFAANTAVLAAAVGFTN